MKIRSALLCAALAAGMVALVPPGATAATVRHEAETAPATCAGTIDANHAGYTGTGFCNAANAVGSAARFSVSAPAAGTATITVRYANGGTAGRPADLLVNGARVTSLAFAGTGTWTGWTPATATVPVVAGANVIRLSPTTSAGLPNVDHLEVTTTEAASSALYVATTGDDAAAGTLAAPLRTIQAAVDRATPGTTIHVRGGTYAPAGNIQLVKDGTAGRPYTLTAYAGERVVIDGENMPYTPGAVGSSIPRAARGAVHVEGDHWRVAGLEIVHGPYGVFGVDTNHGVYDRLVTRDNYESGLHLQGASSGNQILDLDSSGNRDPRKNGESADGVAIKEGSGAGNVIRGARLWNNSDDGLDLWEFTSPVLTESSLAWGNGYNRWDIPGYTGDGNGFKLGGGDPDPAADHVTRNSMAWDNSAHGFTDNGNPGSLLVERGTAWRNGRTGFDLADSTSTLTRNLAVANETPVALGAGSGGSGNSWDLGGTWDLVSTDRSAITGARTSGGAIPSSAFLRPADGADVGARF
ncbi:right-handed parallel beta-helix repeat-containing protein [Myceligenerans crystallogenes]|uniref:CBM35 domain-containing protein n=1 Tax=Myceligenerans crystallogenes TaxID=316335 RepID=A0ABP4ZFK2_9MICO